MRSKRKGGDCMQSGAMLYSDQFVGPMDRLSEHTINMC